MKLPKKVWLYYQAGWATFREDMLRLTPTSDKLGPYGQWVEFRLTPVKRKKVKR